MLLAAGNPPERPVGPHDNDRDPSTNERAEHRTGIDHPVHGKTGNGHHQHDSGGDQTPRLRQNNECDEKQREGEEGAGLLDHRQHHPQTGETGHPDIDQRWR